MSCEHRLVYETLDSIGEVWRSQDQKVELSCFSQKLAICRNFPVRHPSQILISHMHFNHSALAKTKLIHSDISYGYEYFTSSMHTERVQSLGLNRKKPPSHE